MQHGRLIRNKYIRFTVRAGDEESVFQSAGLKLSSRREEETGPDYPINTWISGMLNSERPVVTLNVQKRMHNDANVHSLLLVQGPPVIIVIPSQVKIANCHNLVKIKINNKLKSLHLKPLNKCTAGKNMKGMRDNKLNENLKQKYIYLLYFFFKSFTKLDIISFIG